MKYIKMEEKSKLEIITESLNNNSEVIDMTSLFAEAIYRAQMGLSISKLFG